MDIKSVPLTRDALIATLQELLKQLTTDNPSYHSLAYVLSLLTGEETGKMLMKRLYFIIVTSSLVQSMELKDKSDALKRALEILESMKENTGYDDQLVPLIQRFKKTTFAIQTPEMVPVGILIWFLELSLSEDRGPGFYCALSQVVSLVANWCPASLKKNATKAAQLAEQFHSELLSSPQPPTECSTPVDHGY